MESCMVLPSVLLVALPECLPPPLPPSFPHQAHRGFLNGHKSVKPRLIVLLKAILSSSNEKYHIMVTGHSLGGALSTLFTYDLAQSDLKKQHGFTLSLYNFGSPRVGNHAFAARFNQVRIVSLSCRSLRAGKCQGQVQVNFQRDT
ncbi:unnamed protein product [Closterium sp. Naga37s-1]|nr:unnamed protein product [Closterium sp. Naga37s-1]